MANMKKLLSFVLVLTMLSTMFVGLTVSAAEEPTMTFGNATGKAGQEVDVTLSLSNNPGIVSATVKVTYDSSALELVAANDAGVFGATNHNPDITLNPYTFSWENDTATANFYVNGTIATLKFKIKDGAALGDYTVTTSAAPYFINYDLNEIDFTVVPGKVTVVSCTHENTEEVAAVAATCTEDGYTAGVRCKDCNEFVSGHEVIAKLGHKMTKTEAVAATCTEDGNNEYYTCGRCNKVFKDALGTTGTTVEAEKIAKLGHKMTKTEAVAATCTVDGNNEYYTCGRCSKVFKDVLGTTETTVEAEKLAKLGHDLSWVVTVQPTEGTPGQRHQKCSRCDYRTEDEEFNCLHEHVKDVAAVEPTCTEDGYTAGKLCTDCNTYIEGHTLVAKLGHEMTKTEAVAATCTEDGNNEYYTCGRCNKVFKDALGTTETTVEAEKLTKLGHELTKTEAVAATPTTIGNVAYWTCGRCGKYFADKDGEADLTKEYVNGEGIYIAPTENTGLLLKGIKASEGFSGVISDAAADVNNIAAFLTPEDIAKLADASATKAMVNVKFDIIGTGADEFENRVKALDALFANGIIQSFKIDVNKELYNDITLLAGYPVNLTDLPEKIKITFDIPSALLNKTLKIVREHNGELEIIAPVVSGSRVSFDSDKFSNYALVGYTTSTRRPSTGGGTVTPSNYKVMFNTNGGNTIKDQSVKAGGKATKPEDPTKEGYAFAGWYSNASLTVAYDFDSKVNSNTTIYADWVKVTEANTIVLTIGEKEAKVFGETKENDVAPEIVNDRTMLPIRFIAESLGAKVTWTEETETVIITTKEYDIKLNIGETKATVNNKKVELDVASYVKNDRTYLPLRFVSENLGAIVLWDDATHTVTIVKR